MKYYFLQEDLDQLDLKITELKNKIKEEKKNKHISVTQSSETWHDNFGFEEAEKQINFLANEIIRLLDIKNRAFIINPKKGKQVKIGSEVIYKDETGKELKVTIGSYLILQNKNNHISYQSPLGKILMNAKEGEIKKGLINGKEKNFIILKIA